MTTRVFVIVIVAATALLAAEVEPRFTSIQLELLAVPNSFSNAWGDYDNDGDLDLAVSLGSGEVRLYRNETGVLTSVGLNSACRRRAATSCAA